MSDSAPSTIPAVAIPLPVVESPLEEAPQTAVEPAGEQPTDEALEVKHEDDSGSSIMESDGESDFAPVPGASTEAPATIENGLPTSEIVEPTTEQVPVASVIAAETPQQQPAMDAAIAATLAAQEEADRVEVSSYDAVPASNANGSVDAIMSELAAPSPVPSTSSTPIPASLPTSRTTRFSSTPIDPQTLLEQGRAAALAFAAKTKGQALTRVAQLQARIQKDPLDGEAHLALIQDAEKKGDLERTREVYESFFAAFPDCVSCLSIDSSRNVVLRRLPSLQRADEPA